MKNEKSEIEKLNILRLSNEESNRITKECLEAALLRLLDIKELERITITELVKVAGVSRTAFYSNYNSKEEVLSSWMEQIGNEFTDLFLHCTSDIGSMEIYKNLFDKIRDNHKQIAIIVKANLQYRLSQVMEKLIRQKISVLSREQEYVISGYCGMLNNILLEWYQNDMKEDSKVMAELCVRLITPGMKDIYQTIYEGI